MRPTPTPYWDWTGAEPDVINPGLELNFSGSSDLLMDNFVSGYGMVSGSEFFVFGLWALVFMTVIVAAWAIQRHWGRI